MRRYTVIEQHFLLGDLWCVRWIEGLSPPLRPICFRIVLTAFACFVSHHQVFSEFPLCYSNQSCMLFQPFSMLSQWRLCHFNHSCCHPACYPNQQSSPLYPKRHPCLRQCCPSSFRLQNSILTQHRDLLEQPPPLQRIPLRF